MRFLKKSISAVLIVCLIIDIITPYALDAKEVNNLNFPATPEISLTLNGKNIKITIEETLNAQGYKIMMKENYDKNYKKIKKLKKDGSIKRYYTVKNLSEGDYYFKVKAYNKVNGKTIWGAYSVVRIMRLKNQEIPTVTNSPTITPVPTLTPTPILVPEPTLTPTPEPEQKVKINSTNFPDASFRKFISDKIDLNKNFELSEKEISKVKEMNIAFLKIENLTGIEYFKDLEILKCGSNLLTNLDVSKNLSLKELACSSNKLVSINVKGLNNLLSLSCDQNELTEIDLRELPSLTKLYCSGNKLKTIDLCGISTLKTLMCYKNELTSINLEGAISLEDVRCQWNQLSSIDVTTNTSLKLLRCEDNNLTYLDLSSFDTRNVRTFSGIFKNCKDLKIKINIVLINTLL